MKNCDNKKIRILITAGPTREKIDDVRFITNRSSGKMGYALAEAALKSRMDVTLISGPVCLNPVNGVKTIKVESASEMAAAVFQNAPECEIIISAAAVADYMPETVTEGKIKKREGGLVLKLKRTTDILETLGASKRKDLFLVGFAAETEKLLENAEGKLKKKNLDLIIANNVADSSIGFNSDSNEVTLIFSTGQTVDIPFGSKKSIAETIIDKILNIVQKKHQ
jgi:phosphopantothenoylcysteine decarboxylase/phosphopantothenate--cysteine ligase